MDPQTNRSAGWQTSKPTKADAGRQAERPTQELAHMATKGQQRADKEVAKGRQKAKAGQMAKAGQQANAG